MSDSQSIVTGSIHPADTAASKNTFFKLTPEVSKKLISSKLNRCDMNLWLYLVTLAPFGDRPYSYSAPEAILVCGMNKSTYFKSKAKLQRLGLIDFKDGETKFVNKLALVDNSGETNFSLEKVVSEKRLFSNEKIVSKKRLESPKRDKSLQKETEVSKKRLLEAGTRSGQVVEPLQTIQNFQTSSDLDEEEFKILDRKEEVDQGDVVGTEGVSTLELLTTLVDQPEQTPQPKDPAVDHCSAAALPDSDETINQELLKWLIDVKIPSLELDDPPRNLEAYARGMIRRDGDALQAEFEEVQGDRQFQSKCAELTEKVEARADEWRKVGIPLTVFWDSAGMPTVILDGSAIAANDFLLKPIEPPTVRQIPDAVRANSEKRKSRQSRLRCTDMLGECPGLEFLIECWGDVVLQPQVKVLIAKHPEWGVLVEQLRESLT